jgi:hypothetical protein
MALNDIDPHALTNLILVALTLAVTFVGVLLAKIQVGLKRGYDLVGRFEISNSVYSSQPYLSYIEITNLKDRPAKIHELYLRLGHGYLISLSSIASFTISALDTWEFRPGPVDLYSINRQRFDMSFLSKFDQREMQLMAVTPFGRVDVRSAGLNWHPFIHGGGVPGFGYLQALSIRYEGKAVGDETAFVVVTHRESGKPVVHALLKDEYKFLWFRDLGGGPEDLRSCETVRELFVRAASANLMQFDRIEVHDHQAKLREYLQSEWKLPPIEPKLPDPKMGRIRLFFYRRQYFAEIRRQVRIDRERKKVKSNINSGAEHEQRKST